MKIGVYGSSAGILDDVVKAKARTIGRTIAKHQAILVTGGCPGLPYEAVLGAQELSGQCLGFSPAPDLATHEESGYPVKGFSELIYIPKDFVHINNRGVCQKYRNVVSVTSVDMAIFISGRIGTMNEFTIAYDLGKTIGVLEGTGGITRRAIKMMLEDIDKKTGATVFFESDPTKLVELLLSRAALA